MQDRLVLVVDVNAFYRDADNDSGHCNTYTFPTFDKLRDLFGKQWVDKFPYGVQGVTLTITDAQVMFT